MNVRQVLPRDAIPSVDDPSFTDAYDGDDGDQVIVVDTDAGGRAYPLRYLHHHEIVNDDLATEDPRDPIAVTWCPLCGSAVVYDRVVDDEVLEFGVSGKLADDDLVMYDRETESHWKQSTGVSIAGPLEGTELAVRPARLMTYDQYRATHPDGVVLAAPGGRSETASDDDSPEPVTYEADPYDTYFEMDGFGLDAHRGTGGARDWDRDDDLDPKTVVLGVEFDGEAIGFPLPRVRGAGGVVQTTVGETSVLVVAGESTGIHAYEDPGHSFEGQAGTLRADGTTWDPTTGRSEDGRQLELVPTRRLFAFAWQDDHGPDAFYG